MARLHIIIKKYENLFTYRNSVRAFMTLKEHQRMEEFLKAQN